jgi:3-oxoacyl-(acyl-carrier-protein) synthase III
MVDHPHGPPHGQKLIAMNSFVIDIPVPSMGATVNELTLIDLFIQPGATMAKGEKVAEFESDKSVFEYEAPCDGTVQEIFCRAGDILPSGGPFLRVQTADESLKHLRSTGESVAAAKPSGASAVAALIDEPVKPTQPEERAAAPARAATRPAIIWTPRAQKLAREHGLNPETIDDIVGTGPGGRISGDDVIAYAETRRSAPATAPAKQPAERLFDGTVCVAGIGYAVPKNVRSNKEILKAFPHMTEEEIIRITGIEQRYYADETESVTSLSKIAVSHALEQAGLSVADIDGVIMATIIPDQPVPSAASALAKALGLKRALAFDINAACSGWLYALEVGRAFIRSGTARKLIVVTAELLSRITNPKDHATAFLFGDGAGAAILTDSEGGHRLHRMELDGDATHFEAIQRAGGGARMPIPSVNCKLESFYLSMDGPVVFKQAVIAFANIIESTLKRHEMTPDHVSWIVPHQANERILRAVSKRIGIPYEKFVVTIGKYGNTSAASVSMALGWAAEEEIFNSGDRIIFCSVGAGFTFAGGLLVW